MTRKSDVTLILASASESRRRMLAAAGVSCCAIAADVDERAIRESALARRPAAAPPDIAVELAEAKALAISRLEPSALVIGGDQILAADGRIFEKPDGLAAARRQLEALEGRVHELHSGLALAEAGRVVWSTCQTARLHMRPLSPAFIDHYLDQVGADVCTSVGCYKLEGLGVQLFERIDGDFFTILGLPLLRLLAELRSRGIIAQ